MEYSEAEAILDAMERRLVALERQLAAERGQSEERLQNAARQLAENKRYIAELESRERNLESEIMQVTEMAEFAMAQLEFWLANLRQLCKKVSSVPVFHHALNLGGESDSGNRTLG
jgi:chromosome segregation ATPase